MITIIKSAIRGTDKTDAILEMREKEGYEPIMIHHSVSREAQAL